LELGHLAEDRDKLMAFVNTVMNLWLLKNEYDPLKYYEN
jgi:hypothetical protein